MGLDRGRRHNGPDSLLRQSPSAYTRFGHRKPQSVPTNSEIWRGMVVAMVATVLLINLEKLILTGIVSVKALAYYSVAYTFANMASMFRWRWYSH